MHYPTLLTSMLMVFLIGVLLSPHTAEARSFASSVYKASPYKTFKSARSVCTRHDSQCNAFFSGTAKRPDDYMYRTIFITDPESNTLVSIEILYETGKEDFALFKTVHYTGAQISMPIFFFDNVRDVVENASKEAAKALSKYINKVNQAMTHSLQNSSHAWQRVNTIAEIKTQIRMLENEGVNIKAYKQAKNHWVKHPTSRVLYKIFGQERISVFKQAFDAPPAYINSATGEVQTVKLKGGRPAKYLRSKFTSKTPKMLTKAGILKEATGVLDFVISTPLGAMDIVQGQSEGRDYLIASGSLTIAMAAVDLAATIATAFISSAIGPATFGLNLVMVPIFMTLEELDQNDSVYRSFVDINNSADMKELLAGIEFNQSFNSVWMALTVGASSTWISEIESDDHARNQVLGRLTQWRRDTRRQPSDYPYSRVSRMKSFIDDYMNVSSTKYYANRGLSLYPIFEYSKTGRDTYPSATTGALLLGGNGCDFIKGTSRNDVLDPGNWSNSTCGDNSTSRHGFLPDVLHAGAGDDVIILGKGMAIKDRASATFGLPRVWGQEYYRGGKVSIKGGEGIDTLHSGAIEASVEIVPKHKRDRNCQACNYSRPYYYTSGVRMNLLTNKVGVKKLGVEKSCNAVVSFRGNLNGDPGSGRFSTLRARKSMHWCDNQFLSYLQVEYKASRDDDYYTFSCKEEYRDRCQLVGDWAENFCDDEGCSRITGRTDRTIVGIAVLDEVDVEKNSRTDYWREDTFDNEDTDWQVRMTGIENLVGSHNHDKLVGNDQANIIQGVAGRDLIMAQGGNDQIYTGDEVSKVFAGAGDDHVFINQGTVDPGLGDDLIETKGIGFLHGDEYRIPSVQIRGSVGNDHYISKNSSLLIEGGHGYYHVDVGHDMVTVFLADDGFADFIDKTHDAITLKWDMDWQSKKAQKTIQVMPTAMEELKLLFTEYACSHVFPLTLDVNGKLEINALDTACYDQTDEVRDVSFSLRSQSDSSLRSRGVLSLDAMYIFMGAHDNSKYTVNTAGVGDSVVGFNSNTTAGDVWLEDQYIRFNGPLEKRSLFSAPKQKSFLSKAYFTLYGGSDDDVFFTGEAHKSLVNAGAGNDYLIADLAGTTEVIFNGEEGDDNLRGGAGPDTLIGGKGGDILRGYKGNDVLAGGEGYNRMYGGEGDDIYIMHQAGHNLVLDSSGENFLFCSDDLTYRTIGVGGGSWHYIRSGSTNVYINKSNQSEESVFYLTTCDSLNPSIRARLDQHGLTYTRGGAAIKQKLEMLVQSQTFLDFYGSSYQLMTTRCAHLKSNNRWHWSCDVPAVDLAVAKNSLIHSESKCGCDKLLRHNSTGLYRCERHKPACGDVSFQETLGYPPNMNWYHEVSDMKPF